MKILLPALIALMGIPSHAFCADTDEMFTVLLVRHAEKVVETGHPEDPPLSRCGEERAAALAVQFQSLDLEHVYSTPYDRTMSTARPVAESHDLGIETYEPDSLEEFSDHLLMQQQNSLVVGHSNTTAVLAGLLSSVPGEEFDEDEYDRLYLVTVSGDQRQALLLDQAFRCRH